MLQLLTNAGILMHQILFSSSPFPPCLKVLEIDIVYWRKTFSRLGVGWWRVKGLRKPQISLVEYSSCTWPCTRQLVFYFQKNNDLLLGSKLAFSLLWHCLNCFSIFPHSWFRLHVLALPHSRLIYSTFVKTVMSRGVLEWTWNRNSGDTGTFQTDWICRNIGQSPVGGGVWR